MSIVIARIFLLFVLPVLLIYFKIIKFKYRVHVLSLIVLLTLLTIAFGDWSFARTGVRFDNIAYALVPYCLFTIVGALVLTFIAKQLKKEFTSGRAGPRDIIMSFILSVLQEFLFRGFLMSELEGIFQLNLTVVMINAFLFAFMHIIYLNNRTTIIMIFIGGVGFASIYLYYPNLILVTLAHFILNYIAIRFGFFTKERIYKKVKR